MRILQFLISVLVVCTLAQTADYTTLGAHHVGVFDIAPWEGQGYVGKLTDARLSDREAPAGASLFVVETRPGRAFQSLDRRFGDSYLYQWVATLFDYRFPDQMYEARRELGPGNSLHADIRTAGNGRYSVWNGSLIFSLPEDVNLNASHRLDLVVPVFPANTSQILKVIALFSAMALGIVGFARVFIPRRYRDAIVKSVAPGLAVTGLLAISTVALGEMYFRIGDKFPKSQRVISGLFDPEVGMLLTPGSKIKWTNGIDFWNVENANSLGFADNEPSIPKPPGTYRILFIGPSYVEAVQIPAREKFQSLLLPMLKKAYPNKMLDVVAMGMSGTSQSSQLAYFDRFKERIQPDLVLLVFAQNDFANNSVVLDSVRNGWDPRFPPFLFLEKNHDGRCSRIPISADYAKHLIPGTENERMQRIKMISPDYEQELEGWNPQEQPMDSAFGKADLPAPIFHEALDLTKCAFAEWQQYARTDGFKLAVVANEVLTPIGQIERLRSLLAELQIPMVDLFPTFAPHNPENARFKRDGHWNALGHRLAAEGIFEFVKKTRYLE